MNNSEVVSPPKKPTTSAWGNSSPLPKYQLPPPPVLPCDIVVGKDTKKRWSSTNKTPTTKTFSFLSIMQDEQKKATPDTTTTTPRPCLKNTKKSPNAVKRDRTLQEFIVVPKAASKVMSPTGWKLPSMHVSGTPPTLPIPAAGEQGFRLPSSTMDFDAVCPVALGKKFATKKKGGWKATLQKNNKESPILLPVAKPSAACSSSKSLADIQREEQEKKEKSDFQCSLEGTKWYVEQR
eukprot:CAMPEP_0118704656 /NCGR_PEP_ID=MMETSP0800-20121206/19370_1 /TAXON_ID=210618 ORGANISM="Striatella unipunctata, Strain CCMP2910" /NCGR_SAMPLE_ID=MMETSP0800 /ASSEMBLY_ACC=CAM_ASM_000638 /LENGTH=235 /DNA_ID=CAMNT_0006606597 /DNA_START=183 /DNA_END=886 /DNA_ORIENTATION=-